MDKKKILIVDDEIDVREILSRRLAEGGYDVFQVGDGESAFKMTRDILPDLVITDVVMPNMNGFQATRAITSDPETRHIPVIICTTKDQETDKIWGVRQGAKDYVVKPIKEAELLSKIAALG